MWCVGMRCVKRWSRQCREQTVQTIVSGHHSGLHISDSSDNSGLSLTAWFIASPCMCVSVHGGPLVWFIALPCVCVYVSVQGGPLSENTPMIVNLTIWDFAYLCCFWSTTSYVFYSKWILCLMDNQCRERVISAALTDQVALTTFLASKLWIRCNLSSDVYHRWETCLNVSKIATNIIDFIRETYFYNQLMASPSGACDYRSWRTTEHLDYNFLTTFWTILQRW